MADNICGPSNALQNIQKRSNVDRTLQQDRLVGRASSSQGFRVSPGQNAGQLDAEFAAFQAGHQSLSPSPAVQNFFPRHFQTPSPLSLQNGSSQHTADQGWATDFQNLNISGPQAQFQQQALHQVHQPQMGGGWHQEFAQSFGGSSSVLKGKQPATGMNGPSMMNPRYNPLPPRILMQQNQIASTGPLMAQQNEAFDDAAFARAFEEAANADLEREREKEQELESTKAQTEDAQFTIDQKAELELERAANNLLNQASLGADKIQDPAAATPEQRLDAPDALSRTAGELLHRVSNDRSEKFQNSQFLQLMRQFRDKEVAVEGDEVVDTAKAKSGVYQNGMAGEFHDLTSDFAKSRQGYHEFNDWLAALATGLDLETLMIRVCEKDPEYKKWTAQHWARVWKSVERAGDQLLWTRGNERLAIEYPMRGYIMTYPNGKLRYDIARDRCYLSMQ